MDYLRAAWNSVSQQTIQNSFRKAGFDVNSERQEDDIFPEEHVNADFAKLVQNVSFNDYVDCDDCLPTSAMPTTEELLERYVTEDESDDDINIEDSNDIPVPPPTAKVAISALNTISDFVKSRVNVPDSIFEHLSSLMDITMTCALEKTHQSSILDYFQFLN